MIYVKRWYLNNQLRNYNYMIINSFTKNCLIIDPTDFTKFNNIISSSNLLPEAILITHNHNDHISAVNQIKNEYDNCTVYASFNGKDNNINIDFLIDKPLNLTFNTAEVEVILSPGHTNHHLCFYYYHRKFCH